MFEDEFSVLQADMVDICNEYSQGMADKIFIYAANEGMILVQHFYCINNKIYDCHKLNDSGLQIKFDVSKDCQGKTKKFNAEYTYENQTSDDVSVFDNYDAWFEEEQRRLEKIRGQINC